jgi:hypothetical protein
LPSSVVVLKIWMFKNIVFQPFQIRRECGERSFVFGLWSERSDRSWTVKGAETARKGCGDVEGPKSECEAGRRVQEVQTQTPRSGFGDPRRKVREEPNAEVRSQIPRLDFVVHRGPEEVPEESPGLQRRRPPRDDQGQGDRKIF